MALALFVEFHLTKIPEKIGLITIVPEFSSGIQFTKFTLIIKQLSHFNEMNLKIMKI